MGILLLFIIQTVVLANTGIFFNHISKSINSHINRIYQDHSGFLWICTDNGLSRFDGTQVNTYYHIYGDSTSLITNSVLTVLEDSQSNFWVGTTEGLQRLNRRTGKFETMKFSYPYVNDFSYINCIIEDSRGNIWLSTSRAGAICLKVGTYQPVYYMPTNSNICSSKINVISEDKYGNIWIGSHDKGISVLSVDNNTIVNYEHNPNDPNSISNNKIFAITNTPEGDILIGSIETGIDLFDYATRTITRNYIPGGHRVFTMMNDKKNVLWIGTDGEGVKYYDYTTATTQNYDSYSAGIDMRGVKIHSITEDRQGNIWLAIYQKGIMMIPPYPKTFEVMGYNPFYNQKNIGAECVLSIAEDKKGNIWVGTDGDGIFRLDKEKNVRRHYSEDRMEGKNVLAIFCDSEGAIWVGTYLSGVYKYNERTDSFVRENILIENQAPTDVNVITEDEEGNLWIGTNSNGVCIYNPATGKGKWLQHDIHKTENQLLSNSVQSILIGKDGRVWISTSSAGLSCYNRQTEMFTDCTVATSGLSNDCINQVIEDKSGNLWVGTQTGLNYLNAAIGENKQAYTEYYALLNASVNSMEIDANGNLWVSTSAGLGCFSVTTKQFTSYNVADENMTGEFRRGSSLQTGLGELFFGGTGGMVAFHPFEEMPSHTLLNLIFTGLYVYNEPVKPGSHDGVVLEDNINEAKIVKLSHNIRNFSVGFGAIEYNTPEKVVYQIKMDGFDEDWKTIPLKSRLATYTNLPAGNYSFRVRAFLPGTQPLERVLAIRINPPLWATWWAMVLYFMLASTLLWYTYSRLKEQRIKKKEAETKEQEAQIIQSKLQFFTDISHEIRTPLTLILTPVEQLIKSEKDPHLLGIYKMINQNAHRILRLINQTMDMRRIDRGQVKLNTEATDVYQLVTGIVSSFNYAAREKNIELSLIMAEDMPTVWLDPDIIDKVLVNVISNAFKYTQQGGTIKVQVGVEELSLFVRVSDTGIGIPRELRNSVFNRFFRVANEDNKTRIGTGIGLHISLSLMEIHHGVIFIEDTEGGVGTTFVMRIPLNDSRLKPTEKTSVIRTAPAIESSLIMGHKEEPQPKTRSSKYKYKLLIVEDDDEIRNFLTAILGEQYVISQATDGKEGLEKAIREQPDCIISDLMMPRMDGLEMCSRLKQNEQTLQIPVILLTARATIEDRIEGLRVGADSYIPKPFNADHLLTRVAKLIELRAAMNSKFSGKFEQTDVTGVKSADDLFLEKLENIVRERIDDPDLSVETISSEMGVSRSQFQRKMKQLIRQNPSEYIKTSRLRHAARLLATRKLTISEVTYATGFSSLSHFSNSFREQYGVSPTRYMELNSDNIEV